MSINAIQNPSSMKNTTIQPSQLNGGNLANVFNLQSMRTVKGRVELNTEVPPPVPPPNPKVPIDFVVNSGSPTILGPGAFTLYDYVQNGVRSTNSFGAGNFTISIQLPSIYYGNSNNQISISSSYTQILIPNFTDNLHNYQNYIQFRNSYFQVVTGSPYTPGDTFLMIFNSNTNTVTFQLSNSVNGIYFSLNQPYTGVSFNLFYTSGARTSFSSHPYNFTNATIQINTTTINDFNTYQVIDTNNNPVTLGLNDFIIGYSVANGNINKTDTDNPYPLTPIQNSPIVQFVINPIPPVWSEIKNMWIPQLSNGITVRPVTQTLTNGSVNSNGPYINSGFGKIGKYSVLVNTSCGLDSWLQMTQSGSAFTIEGSSTTAGAINITLIILTI